MHDEIQGYFVPQQRQHDDLQQWNGFSVIGMGGGMREILSIERLWVGEAGWGSAAIVNE